MMRALLDNDEVVGLAEPLPYFRELRSEQLPEKRADAHVCEVITVPPNRAPAGGIISVLGMIQSLFHEPGKRSRAALLNFRADNVDQSRVSSGHLVNR